MCPLSAGDVTESAPLLTKLIETVMGKVLVL